MPGLHRAWFATLLLVVACCCATGAASLDVPRDAVAQPQGHLAHHTPCHHGNRLKPLPAAAAAAAAPVPHAAGTSPQHADARSSKHGSIASRKLLQFAAATPPASPPAAPAIPVVSATPPALPEGFKLTQDVYRGRPVVPNRAIRQGQMLG